MENIKRTTIKIIVWQCIALTITTIILQIAMGDITKAITFGLIDHSICMTIHYFYERFWQNINWGIIENED